MQKLRVGFYGTEPGWAVDTGSQPISDKSRDLHSHHRNFIFSEKFCGLEKKFSCPENEFNWKIPHLWSGIFIIDFQWKFHWMSLKCLRNLLWLSVSTALFSLELQIIHECYDVINAIILKLLRTVQFKWRWGEVSGTKYLSVFVPDKELKIRCRILDSGTSTAQMPFRIAISSRFVTSWMNFRWDTTYLLKAIQYINNHWTQFMPNARQEKVFIMDGR